MAVIDGRKTLLLMIALCLPFSVTACGNKGGLKSPSQIREQEAKKAREAEKRTRREQARQPEQEPIIEIPLEEEGEPFVPPLPPPTAPAASTVD